MNNQFETSKQKDQNVSPLHHNGVLSQINIPTNQTKELQRNISKQQVSDKFLPHKTIKESNIQKNKQENNKEIVNAKIYNQLHEIISPNKNEEQISPKQKGFTSRVFKLPLMEKIPNLIEGQQQQQQNRGSPVCFSHRENNNNQPQNNNNINNENKIMKNNLTKIRDPLQQLITERGQFFNSVLGKQNFAKIKSLERQNSFKQNDYNSRDKPIYYQKQNTNDKQDNFEINNQEYTRCSREQFYLNSRMTSSSPLSSNRGINNYPILKQYQYINDYGSTNKQCDLTNQQIHSLIQSSKVHPIPYNQISTSNTLNQFDINSSQNIINNNFSNNNNNINNSNNNVNPYQYIYGNNRSPQVMILNKTMYRFSNTQNNNNHQQFQTYQDDLKCGYSSFQINQMNVYNRQDSKGIDKNEQYNEENDIIMKNNEKKKIQFQQQIEKYNSSSLIERIPSQNVFEETYLKVFVGSGNNCNLIKNVAAQRWWYEIFDLSDKATSSIFSADSSVYSHKINHSSNTSNNITSKYVGDMIWTQIKQNYIINDMPSIQELILQQNNQSNPQQTQQNEENNSTSILNLDNINNENKHQYISKLNSLEIEDEQNQNQSQINNNNRKYLQLSNQIKVRVYNHLECNYQLSNKKNMYYNLKEYYERLNQPKLLFERIPYTFHIKKASNKDISFQQFIKYYNKLSSNSKKENIQQKSKNIWIVKPAENTNRGTGIFVSRDINEIKEHINQNNNNNNNINQSKSDTTYYFSTTTTTTNRSPQQQNRNKNYQQPKHTYIIQKYIENPLLYDKRKIDIRCYLLITNYNGIIKAYWYKDGYIRTSSKEFTTKNLKNNFIHLTNDAIQKKQLDYGKYEQGNKISYQEFQRYLNNSTSHNINFVSTIIPQMKQYALDCVKSVFTKIDPNRKQYCFELFGLDYMIDNNLNVWLIEVNANPCLEQSCSLLTRIIPPLIHNTIKITTDPLSQGVRLENWNQDKNDHFNKYYQQEQDKFECIFDELIHGDEINLLYSKQS